jgi:hypothetical protein
MTLIKFCKDCKYIIPQSGYCTKLKPTKISLVDGLMRYLPSIPAAFARDDEDRCGYSAKHFEPKVTA